MNWKSFLDEIVAGTAKQPPFVARLGLPQPSAWSEGRIEIPWEVDPGTFHGGGQVFGGYLAAVADHALALAAMTVMSEGEKFTTSDLRVSFFRPVREGTVAIEGSVVHRGRRMCQVEVTFTQNERCAGKATATQVILSSN